MSGLTSEDSVQLLGEVLSGPVLAPGDRGYDEARRVHNGLIDRHPAAIARCLHTADVADAVNFGRSEGLEISVRGGGHSVAGGPNYERLVELKRRYDADNLFRLNHNIDPKA